MISYQRNRKKKILLVYKGSSKVGFIQKGLDGYVFVQKGKFTSRPFPTEETCQAYVELIKDFNTHAQRETKPNNSLMVLK